jgi:hypothetical protein
VKRILLLVVAFGAAYYGYLEYLVPHVERPASSAGIAAASQPERWRSGEQVRGEGTVIRILPDDNDGSRHQRFIIRLASGRTLLIAHNIDLAPRIPTLRTGDGVAFNGEYEWNDQGGVIHWTHHDPQGRHAAGWLEHDGRRYQ